MTTWSSISSTRRSRTASGCVQRVAAGHRGQPLGGVHRAGAGRGAARHGEPGEHRQTGEARHAVDEVAHQQRVAHRVDADDAVRPLGRVEVPGAQHVGQRVPQRHRHLAVGTGEQLAQLLAPAEVGEPGDRASGRGLLVGRDLAAQVDVEVGHRAGPHPPGLDAHPGPAQPRRRVVDGRSARGVVELEAATVVAAPARRRLRVVERVAQELQPAVVGRRVGQHRVLLRGARRRDARVAVGVVVPLLAGGLPPPAYAPDRPVDVEHLEHRLQPGAAQRHVRLQRGRRHRAALVGEHLQRAADVAGGRERQRAEVVPDVAVLAAGQQHHRRLLDTAAGAAHLLVVADRAGRCTEVHDEAEVGLVEAHAECGRGHQRLDPVVQQVVLGGEPLGLLGLAGVGRHLDAVLAQVVGHQLGVRDGEAVDDARPGQAGQVLGEPGQPVGLGGKSHHAELQRLAVEAAAQHQHVGQRPFARDAQLLGDVGGHPCVGRRCRGQHRDAVGQVGEQGADPPVVGTEVVAPVGDAVRLVDHQQTGARRQVGQHPVAELGVVQPLRADQQHVDLAAADRGVGLLPRLGVGRVDGDRADARALGRQDLVAHQGEQRRDDHRRSRAGTLGRVPQQRGGDEVDRRLAPAGALDDECAPPAHDQRLDGRPLVVAQLRVVVTDEGTQVPLGLGSHRHLCSLMRGGRPRAPGGRAARAGRCSARCRSVRTGTRRAGRAPRPSAPARCSRRRPPRAQTVRARRW